MLNSLAISLYGSFRFIVSNVLLCFLLSFTIHAQHDQEATDSILKVSSRLLRSNHQQKALKIIVPLYYEKLEQDIYRPSFQELTYQLVRILERTNQHKEALRIAEQWLDKGSFKPFYKTRLFTIKALVFEKIGEEAECQNALKNVERLLSQNDWPELTAEFFVRKSSFHRIFQSKDSARYYAEKALSIAIGVDNPWHIGDSYLLLGFTAKSNSEVLENLKKALHQFKILNDTDGIGFMYLNIFDTYGDLGQSALERSYLDSTRQYAQGSSFLDLTASYQLSWSSYLKEKQQYKEALDAYESAMVLLNQREEQQQQAILYVEKYKLDNEQQLQLGVLKRLNDLENQNLTKQRNRVILFMVLLLFLLSIILYLYFLKQRQGKIILEERKTVQTRNSELEDSLKQNKLLLQELQHRVKNNLQFIISIVSLQVEASASPQIKEALEVVLTRVGAVASVHDKLYLDSHNGGVLNQQFYIKNLLNNLRSILDIHYVEIELDVDDFSLDPSRSIAMGMVITELVTNSIKHAFTQKKPDEQKIALILKKDISKDELSFYYSDNGQVLTKEISEGLGLELIQLFAKQLKAAPEMSFDTNFSLKMTFPL